jgi:hypothetical protein
MNLLARVFGSSEPPAKRERLRQALALESSRVVALDLERAGLERVENVFEAARAADRRVRDAARAAADAAAKWAAAGADPADSEHERLRAAIAVAERHAEQCWFAARGAEAGIGEARKSVSRCESALRDAQREVKESIGLIIYAELGPRLLELEIAVRQLERARLEIWSARRVVDPSRPGWNDDATHAASEAARLLRGDLQRCEIHPLGERTMRNGFTVPSTHTPAAVLERTAAWADFAKRLRTDPDAVF